MDGIDLTNLELSDRIPDWESRDALKSRVSARLLADLNSTPIRTLSNAESLCSSCTTDLCNVFEIMNNISCSVRFGIQSLYLNSRQQMCAPHQGCLVHTNVTWTDDRFDRVVCLPQGCSPGVMSQCERMCSGPVDSRVKKCSCWCNGDYSVKSYTSPSAMASQNSQSADTLKLSSYCTWIATSIFLSKLFTP